MKDLGLHEIRREFLDFFKEKDHLVMPSFPLIPKSDKSLLLIGAGMAPLKKFFTGEEKPPSKRLSTCQKCIRTGDIENVGITARHATFFEMLGNFSFGDYFKKEAIEWAWEFLTVNMEIPKEDLWVSVYEEDQKAFDIWLNDINVAAERIVKLGKKDNFWELEVGPSGPCSEIYVDRGHKYGCGLEDCKPGCECDRFLEVWNLVFTQFDKDAVGNYNPLSHPNIDTGMGLERLATVLQGADNIFEVREIRGIINKVEELSSYKYGTNKIKDISVRVITDHVRAMTFLVSDGVLPSNEGRGYVLRRIIRRAARHGKLLGIDSEFLTKIVEELINSWKVEYKDLEEKEVEIKNIIRAEEKKFQQTIDQGIEILNTYISHIKNKGKKILSGEQAFKLYDTYGFPLDLVKEILAERSLSLDEKEFNIKMEEQRQRARTARESGDSGWGNNDYDELFKGFDTSFEGYENIELSSRILSLFKDSQRVDELTAGDEGVILLDKTPFYGESGGQVGDRGIIKNDDFTAEVMDTKLNKDGVYIHLVKVMEGSASEGNKVLASIENTRRESLRKNHSATHLLHKALKEVVGQHVNQAGSIVLPNRFRFDFTHFQALTKDELARIERKVNEKILASLDVETIERSLDQAKEMGAIGLFDEKYDDKVRIVKMGDYSMELCGGTHVLNTSNIGLFKIVAETGIASGVRRIEGITGISVYDYMLDIEEDLEKVSNVLKTNKNNLYDKSISIMEEIKLQEKEIQELEAKLSKDISKSLIDTARDIMGVPLITYKTDSMDINALRTLGDEIKSKINSGVIVLASTANDKLIFISMVTKDLIDKGIKAGNIVKELALITGGNGGGRPDMAQAGGKDISKLDYALKMIEGILEALVK